MSCTLTCGMWPVKRPAAKEHTFANLRQNFSLLEAVASAVVCFSLVRLMQKLQRLLDSRPVAGLAWIWKEKPHCELKTTPQICGMFNHSGTRKQSNAVRACEKWILVFVVRTHLQEFFPCRMTLKFGTFITMENWSQKNKYYIFSCNRKPHHLQNMHVIDLFLGICDIFPSWRSRRRYPLAPGPSCSKGG